MQIFSKIFNSILAPFYSKPVIYPIGPNNFSELLKQFDEPIKEKTNEDVIRDYKIFITMANLECDMLKMEPAISYRGHRFFIDDSGQTVYDWVPCIVRPEVIYCSYGKN